MATVRSDAGREVVGSAARPLVLLFAITLFGLWLRVIAVGTMPLWSDEALTLLISKWPIGTLLFRPVDPTPALYYLLHKMLIPGNADVTQIRSISVVCGVVLIPVTYAFGSLIGGIRTGLLASFFVALSAQLVDYSQEARAYSLLVLLILTSAIGLLKILRVIIDGPSFDYRRAAAFAVPALLAFYTHFVAVFWIIPAFGALLFVALTRGDPAIWRGLRLTVLAFILLAVPGLARLFWSVTSDIGFNWLHQATGRQFLATVGEVLMPLGVWPEKLEQPGRILTAVALIITLFAVCWLCRQFRLQLHQWRVEYPASLLVLGIFLALPFELWAIGFLTTPIFMPRTMLWAVPGYLTSLAVVLDRVNSRWIIGLTATVCATSLAASGTLRSDRQDTRGFQREIARGEQRGDVLLLCRDWRAPELRYAAGAPLAMPLIAPMFQDMSVIERQFGSDTRWQEHFGWLVGRPVVIPKVSMIATSGRAWLLASGCSEYDRVRFNRWLGPGRWVKVRSDTSTALLPIVLWRFDPAAPPKLRPVLDFSQNGENHPFAPNA